MEKFRSIVTNVVLVLQVLILWAVIFENRIELPSALQAFGRMHPLLLHFPIGLLFVAAVLSFFRKRIPSFPEEIFSVILQLAVLTTSLTTLMGLFLSQEGGYDQQTIVWHKWGGVVLSFAGWLLLIKRTERYHSIVLGVTILLLVFVGHFGATLTHGDQYVLEPLTKHQPRNTEITDSSTFFEASITPVLEAKCAGCHREGKRKGRLDLTSVEGVLKGGKNGKLFLPGDAEHSLIIERLELPLEAKEHMPPRDKTQLTENERKLIAVWIARGADMKVKLSAMAADDSLRVLSESVRSLYTHESPAPSKYNFRFASQTDVAKLNTPNRTVARIAGTEPALAVTFYLRGQFDPKQLQELEAVSEQVVSLNLTSMPVADKDLDVLLKFPNLEKLVLNNTKVKGDFFPSLRNNKKLTSISLSGTATSAENLKVLGQSSVRDVFVWNTAVDNEIAKNLGQEFPAVNWHTGFVPDENELLQLKPAIVRNESNVIGDEGVTLGHNLPGAEIRYSVDETPPDSLKGLVYKQPVRVDGYAVIKSKVYRTGWKSSDLVEHVFFKKGKTPAEATLNTKPNDRYQGEGAVTFVNGQKGMPDFFRDPSWIGFREQPLEAVFRFNDTQLNEITISYARNVGAMCMPPASMEVWGQKTGETSLKLLRKITPQQPADWVPNRIEGASVEIPEGKYSVVRVVATPLKKLPVFRNAGKETGWLMVDEIFFN